MASMLGRGATLRGEGPPMVPCNAKLDGLPQTAASAAETDDARAAPAGVLLARVWPTGSGHKGSQDAPCATGAVDLAELALEELMTGPASPLGPLEAAQMVRLSLSEEMA